MFRLLLATAIVSTLSANAFAATKTTLEFPLKLSYFATPNREVDLDVAKLNRKLSAAGKAGLPETIVVNADSRPYFLLLMKRLEVANEVWGKEINTPAREGYLYEYPEICYRGKAADVFETIKALTGQNDGSVQNFFNHDQGMLAARYGTKKIVEADQFKSVSALREYYGGDNEGEIDGWEHFDTSSKDVIVWSDLGPQGDGTELYLTVIKPCR
jgi:hypothetical protein